MRLVGRQKLSEFMGHHAGARASIEAWVAEVESADWQTPLSLSARYPSASFLPGNRIVFRLRGNAYRLLVTVNYAGRIVLVQKIGTHAEYDKWNL